MKGKFQLRFVAGFVLATGSLAIAALIVRADSAQHRRTQGEISNGLVTALAAQDVVRKVDNAEAERDLYLRSGDEEAFFELEVVGDHHRSGHECEDFGQHLVNRRSAD